MFTLLFELLLLFDDVLSLLVFVGSLLTVEFASTLLSLVVVFILSEELFMFTGLGSFVAVEPASPLSFVSLLPLASILASLAAELFIIALPSVGVEGFLPVEVPLLLLSLLVIILPEPPLKPPIDP